MAEKELQDYYIKFLEKRNIPYIHIPNRAFSKSYRTPKCIKDFPDLDFQYNGTRYLREYGVPGAHLDNKERQWTRMMEYEKQGANIMILTSMDAVMDDIQRIFNK